MPAMQGASLSLVLQRAEDCLPRSSATTLSIPFAVKVSDQATMLMPGTFKIGLTRCVGSRFAQPDVELPDLLVGQEGDHAQTHRGT